jgi:hypothetical protein
MGAQIGTIKIFQYYRSQSLGKKITFCPYSRWMVDQGAPMQLKMFNRRVPLGQTAIDILAELILLLMVTNGMKRFRELG